MAQDYAKRAAPGAGEANTSSNTLPDSATEKGLALPKIVVDLPFKVLKAGANITLTATATDVEIAAAAGGLTIQTDTAANILALAGSYSTSVLYKVTNLMVAGGLIHATSYVYLWAIDANTLSTNGYAFFLSTLMSADGGALLPVTMEYDITTDTIKRVYHALRNNDISGVTITKFPFHNTGWFNNVMNGDVLNVVAGNIAGSLFQYNQSTNTTFNVSGGSNFIIRRSEFNTAFIQLNCTLVGKVDKIDDTICKQGSTIIGNNGVIEYGQLNELSTLQITSDTTVGGQASFYGSTIYGNTSVLMQTSGIGAGQASTTHCFFFPDSVITIRDNSTLSDVTVMSTAIVGLFNGSSANKLTVDDGGDIQLFNASVINYAHLGADAGMLLLNGAQVYGLQCGSKSAITFDGAFSWNGITVGMWNDVTFNTSASNYITIGHNNTILSIRGSSNSSLGDGNNIAQITVVDSQLNKVFSGTLGSPVDSLTVTSSTINDLTITGGAGGGQTFLNAVLNEATIDYAGFANDVLQNIIANNFTHTFTGAAETVENDIRLNGLHGITTKDDQFGTLLANKVTPVAADRYILEDSAASFAKKYLTHTQFLASISYVDSIAGFVETVADKTYKLVVKIPFACTINETVTICTGGTATATFKINTIALGGTANAVSTSEVTEAHVSANVVAINDDIQLTISANAACLDMSFLIKYTRSI